MKLLVIDSGTLKATQDVTQILTTEMLEAQRQKLVDQRAARITLHDVTLAKIDAQIVHFDTLLTLIAKGVGSVGEVADRTLQEAFGTGVVASGAAAGGPAVTPRSTTPAGRVSG